MTLYHYSSIAHKILIPQLGGSRHGGEDSAAVGKPLIWLTTGAGDPPWIRNGERPTAWYRHQVEIEENDPNLTRDEPFFKMATIMQRIFRKQPPAWYFYTRELLPMGIAKWDETKNTFEIVPPENEGNRDRV